MRDATQDELVELILRSGTDNARESLKVRLAGGTSPDDLSLSDMTYPDAAGLGHLRALLDWAADRGTTRAEMGAALRSAIVRSWVAMFATDCVDPSRFRVYFVLAQRLSRSSMRLGLISGKEVDEAVAEADAMVNGEATHGLA